MNAQNLKQEIANCLNEIKGGGTFCSQGTQDFVFPRLSVDGLDEIAYPINTIQAKAIISAAHKAPYGKGHDTIIDANVRSAWEIDASLLQFDGTEWSGLIDRVLGKVQQDLGIADYTVEAKLYKLLVYEKGDFFLTHKDTEKENNMFGTLIVSLPSTHQGGELFVRFEGEEKMVDFSKESHTGKIAFASFYADCDHEVKPLTDGYRVVLVYNLIQKSTGKEIAIQSYKKHVDCLKACFTKAKSQISDSNRPLVVLLNHQYTPENFIQAHLKLNDRAKAIALLQAANETGLYANLCLVTATKEGSPLEHDEDCEIIDEIFDESICIEKWTDDGCPALGDFYLDDDHIIAPFNMDDDEPYEVENSGYMGNYGPDITYWYHYGAVAVWTEEQHKRILLDASDAIRIKWLDYYNTNRDKLKHKDLEMAGYLVQILSSHEDDKEKFDFGPVIDWLILENDKMQLHDLGYQLLERYFFKIKGEKWFELGQHYGIESINDLLNNHIKSWNQKRVKQVVAILHEFSEKRQFDEFVSIQMALLPSYYFKMVTELRANDFPIDAKTLKKLAELETS
jgi:2OG-Fe(II) oxygenase superfamily